MGMVAGIGIYEPGKYAGAVSRIDTKEYKLWHGMLLRCTENALNPSYIGCSVHPDFIKFQEFAEWCQHQIGFGLKHWALDKDILVPGNKVYGPDTCCFVPTHLNNMITHQRTSKGEYPTGVSYFKRDGTFQAHLRIDGIKKRLGSFQTPEEAEAAYKSAKASEICRRAKLWEHAIDRKVYLALMNYEV